MNRMTQDYLMKPAASLAAALALSLLFACGAPAPETAEMPAEPAFPPQLPGYAAMDIPADNPLTEEKAELGKMLYYDKRMSGDGVRSCYGCHVEEYGLTDGRRVALGAFDRELTRNTPTMWNVGYYEHWYWDGRATALEAQVKGAWSGGNMGASGQNGAPSMDDVAATLNGIPEYQQRFEAVFGGPATPDNIAMAVASFMRTIVAWDSPWVRFRNGDDNALSADAKKGWELFSGKAKCTNCHDGLLLTDQQFHSAGIGVDKPNPDVGRFAVTQDEGDKFAFKTPTLYDVSKSAPYFHDGSVATLEEAVHIMAQGGANNAWETEENLREVKEANLTDEDEQLLLAFLREVTAVYHIQESALP